MSALESRLDKKIEDLCKEVGAFHQKTHGSAYQVGLPDHLVCYQGRFIGLEAKASDGKPSVIQKAKLRKIQRAGGIGEFVYSIDRVREIFSTIDRGEKWVNTDYRVRPIALS